ncbi:hypothetical protein B0J11DRAFT_334728 [Dendryphion nanum]|uniref:Uncharacterized protein n=1 Tax=Dendryphion nanum TaxID=256645 RepID=A0A9P9DNS4_9PLEO|nr:hypothetical protein B0J11DRAFT_334728 [Dendryphion nanum]
MRTKYIGTVSLFALVAVAYDPHEFGPADPGTTNTPGIVDSIDIPNQQIGPIIPGNQEAPRIAIPTNIAQMEPTPIGAPNVIPSQKPKLEIDNFLTKIFTKSFSMDIPSVTSSYQFAWPTAGGGNPGGHLACADADFQGDCHYYYEPPSGCHNYEFERWDKWTAIKPNKGQYCYFFEEADCYGSKVELRWPGTNNLRGKKFDNRIKSWNCWTINGGIGTQ